MAIMLYSLLKDISPKITFKDAPDPEEFLKVVSTWWIPKLSFGPKFELSGPKRNWFFEFSSYFISKIDTSQISVARLKNEITLVKCLFELIRLNIKRGRIFDLREVLDNGEADCLGYAKLFTVLGRLFGLNVGVIEVVTDILGRNVPHTASLVKLTGGKYQIVDFWYGSKNIRHKRLGMQIKKKGVWQIKDIDYSDIKKIEDLNYLQDEKVDAITLYIEGNRFLSDCNYRQAITKYNESAAIYPENSRIYYNRAICYEKLGKSKKAIENYSRALCCVSALRRTLATQPQDVVDLIQLDHHFVPEIDQVIYLLHNGFVTGRKESPEKIANKLHLSVEEVESILSFLTKLYKN